MLCGLRQSPELWIAQPIKKMPRRRRECAHLACRDVEQVRIIIRRIGEPGAKSRTLFNQRYMQIHAVADHMNSEERTAEAGSDNEYRFHPATEGSDLRRATSANSL